MEKKANVDISHHRLNIGGGWQGNEPLEGVYSSPAFRKACKKAGIPATTRQASKFRNKKGLAYKMR